MKTLVIAEKPDMGRNIAAAIEPKAIHKRTYIEGKHYIFTWAIGHLLTLAEPDQYDEKYKKWDIRHLPIIPDSFLLIPNEKTKHQLQVISELAKRCSQIINACDAGREGQLIFSFIQQYLRLRQPVKRLWISDLTPETIRRGFHELKDEAEFENLTKAAKARSQADWLIGINGSRAFTTKHRELLSVGRVQTPVLALIYDRQVQIEQFSSLTFYTVEAEFSQSSTKYKGIWQGERIVNPDEAQRIAAKTRGKTGRIASYEVKHTKEYPHKLFDLTLLQREANAKFAYSAKKTLDIAQSLYEKHKAITYPRTNSNYVTVENIPEMHRTFDGLRQGKYAEWAKGGDKQFVHKKNPNLCNPSKVEDHHAILPTTKFPTTLMPEEQKIYDLIVQRFLSHFYPAAEYHLHAIFTEVEKETFKTTIKEQLAPGWKKLYQDSEKKKRKSGDDDTEETVTDRPFSLDANQPVHCNASKAKEKETKPPKPFTEGTLLKAMESAGKQMENEELRDAMKESGLGTPATRAATIERLKQVGYIQMKGKQIAITQKGRTAVELIRNAGVDLLTSPEMTGRWEKRLNEIAKGAADEQAFMEKVKQFAAYIVEKVRVQTAVSRSAFEAAPKAAMHSTTASSPASSKRTGRKRFDLMQNIAACPREGCGGTIIAGRKGYGCNRFKAGCTFVIWKENFGKTLSEAAVRALIEKGKTRKMKFLSPSGKTYEASIVLADRNTGELRLST